MNLQLDSDDYSFSIEHLEYKQAMNMSEMHSHNSFEIYYQMSGGRNYFVEDKFYSTKKGDILIIAPGIKHKTTYAGIKSYQRFCLYFKPEFLNDLLQFENQIDFLNYIDKYLVIELGSNEREKIEFLFFDMLEEFNSKPKNHTLNLQLMLGQLLLRLDRYTRALKSTRVYSPNMYRVISDVCLYLQDNFDQEVKLENLAEHFSLSSFYLSRKFKEITKSSIPQYINNIRIDISKELLKNTGHTITEIASKVGFTNSSHFARVFKKYVRLTPQAFRNKHKNICKE